MKNPTLTPIRHTGLDRFLVFILVGIGLLLVLAVVSMLLLKQPVPVPSTASPDQTVLSFLTALKQKDYSLAYSYLSDNMIEKPSLEVFSRFNDSRGDYELANSRIAVDKVTPTGEGKANVVIRFFDYNSGSIFGEGQYTSTENFVLQQEEGTWRITWLSDRYFPIYYPYKG